MKALSIRGLTKTYPNGVEALKGIDLDVDEGDFFGLLGPNGAGKSTTIGIVTSLINRTAGSISVFGIDTQRDHARAKACIGLVPQEFNFSVFERVRHIVANQAGYYGIDRGEAAVRAEDCLRRLGLWDKRDQAARFLSGGMKRRLLIARALVHGPKLLILDEPTAGVDIELRRSMWEFLREINRQGTTIILTTHYLEEAESLCRNLAIIDRGTIVENTSVKRLLAKLDIETFVLDLRQPLDTAPALDGVTTRLVDATTLEIDLSKSRSLNTVFADLGALGVEVTSMRNKANRLEELFLDLVERGVTPPAASGS